MIYAGDSREKKEIMVRIQDELTKFLILEVAWGRGHKAWGNGRTPLEVCLRCDQDEREELLEATRPVAKVLRLRMLESLAEAVVAAGGRLPEVHTSAFLGQKVGEVM